MKKIISSQAFDFIKNSYPKAKIIAAFEYTHPQSPFINEPAGLKVIFQQKPLQGLCTIIDGVRTQVDMLSYEEWLNSIASGSFGNYADLVISPSQILFANQDYYDLKQIHPTFEAVANWNRLKYLKNLLHQKTNSKSILLKWLHELKAPKNKKTPLSELALKYPEIKFVTQNGIDYFQINGKKLNAKDKQTHLNEIKQVMQGGKTIISTEKKVKSLYQTMILAHCHKHQTWDSTEAVEIAKKLILKNHDFDILEEIVFEHIEQALQQTIETPKTEAIKQFVTQHTQFKNQQNHLQEIMSKNSFNYSRL